MKNLGMIFFLAVAFIFVSSQAQAQSATKTSCKKTCKKVGTLQCNASTTKRNTAMLTLLGNDKTTKKTTSCQPAQCKKGANSASAVKLVSNKTVETLHCNVSTCNKNVKVTEKREKVNVTKAVLAKNE
jgi:hypothetical protein